MLHRSKSLRGDISRPIAVLSVVAIVIVAICAAGIRSSMADDQGASTPSTGDKTAWSKTVAFLDQAAAEPKAEAPPEPNPIKERVQRSQTMNNLKQLVLAMHNYHDKHKHFPPATVTGPDGGPPHSWRIELLPDLDQKRLYDQYRMNEPWDSENNKKVLEQMPSVFKSPFDNPNSTNSSYYVITGPGTIFEGKDGIPIQDITDGTSNTLIVVESKRNTPWTKPEDIPFDPERPLPAIGGFMNGLFAGALADGSARIYVTETVEDQLKWLIMRNDHHPIDIQKLGVDPRRAGGRVMPMPVANAGGLATPADQARNNLKQLMLAMHNYHDIHGQFPPAVVMGPDGKTPHSWRVELLPVLDLKGLYERYRLNEPWDSPHNEIILRNMPDVFHSPYDDPKSLNSGYYVLVGPGTVFEGPKGIKIADILDGTSNTLAIVEAKRKIPWTKPEDIPFDPDKPLPELGGFVEDQFRAAFADGSVRSLQTERIKDELKWLIMRNDGHVINAR